MPGLAGSCRLAAVRAGGQPAPRGIVSLDGSAPITLVLTTATGGISGAALNEEGKPKAGFVLLVSQDGENAVRVGQIDAEGRYGFSDVPVGPYRLNALTGLDSVDYLDPLASTNLGVRVVTIEAGREVTSDLRLVRK